MALSTDEKSLLRKAICDGAFSDNSQPSAQRTLTPDQLAAVSAMSDADVRVVLRAYQATKAAALQQAVARTQARISEAQAEKAAVEAVVIQP